MFDGKGKYIILGGGIESIRVSEVREFLQGGIYALESAEGIDGVAKSLMEMR